MTGFYSRAAMRQAREKPKSSGAHQQPRTLTLADVPADAEYEDAGAVLHVWADNKFVPYATWLASAPISIESVTTEQSTIPADARCVAADCNETRVWLVRDGDRWLMFAGSRGPAARRRDFASPFLGHAIRTAEFWYGAPTNGWRAERKGDARAEAANG